MHGRNTKENGVAESMETVEIHIFSSHKGLCIHFESKPLQ